MGSTLDSSLEAASFHAERRRVHTAERRRLAARVRLLSRARLLTFVLAIAALASRPGDASLRSASRAAAALLAVSFVVLVPRHRRAQRLERRAAALEAHATEGEQRVRREWGALPLRAPLDGPEGHPYARDLDIFGRASLLQLLGGAMTAPGRITLTTWLLAPAPPAVVRARQQAVAELAPMIELREELAAGARLAGRTPIAEMERLLAWAEGPAWHPHAAAVAWAARLVTVATLATLAVAATDWGKGIWIAPVVAGGLLSSLVVARARRTLDAALARGDALRHYAALLERIAGAPLASPHLAALRERVGHAGGSAAAEIARLGRIADAAEVKYSPMLYLPLQIFLLWDLHTVDALDRWRRRAGRRVRGWIEAVGEAESLAALAALRHDNPGWCTPELLDGEPPRLEAESLAHPLLAAGVRVANDVALGPPGTTLLVTGSNMSGKSTLLRAIGLNVVLAQCGGPACARRLRLTPLLLETSMQIDDSLERGLSRFMAELTRLKEIVEAARRMGPARASAAAGTDGGSPALLYLLDEILQGTNTAERQVAARRILRHLLAHRAIGAVTSHDLALADEPDLAAASRPVHFTEQVVERDGVGAMTFDYTLRPGLATSVNALRLMSLVGLD
jgi:hypothetical protein